jgi:hypothetical protein
MTHVQPMANPSVHCPWPTIQKDLRDSADAPTQVSSQAADGNQPVAHLSELCRCSPTHGLLRSKRLHVHFTASPVFCRNKLQRIDESQPVHTPDLYYCVDNRFEPQLRAVRSDYHAVKHGTVQPLGPVYPRTAASRALGHTPDHKCL